MSENRIISRADIVFDTLENRIISGEYAPGEVLSEQKISEESGVSRTPVREALNRLKQAELVKETGRGLTVVGITREDIEDIYTVRMRVEGLAAARCAEKITAQQLEELKNFIEMEEYYVEKAMGEKLKDVDNQFHEKMYEYSESHVFLSVLTTLHKKVQKYRKLSIQKPERGRVATNEHRAIYEALAAHDPVAAEEAALAHVLSAKAHVLEVKVEEEKS